MAAGAPDIVAAVCVRDHWQNMSQDQHEWCTDRICSAIAEHANDWNRSNRVQRFSMSPDRSCAWAVALLLTKQLSDVQRNRVEKSFVASLTHPIGEVRWYATWGTAELWSHCRDIAVRSLHAIAEEANSIASAWAEEEPKLYSQRRPYEEMTAEVADGIRERFWKPHGIAFNAYDQLDVNEWHGAEAQNRILAILGKVPDEPLAAQAFTRAAKGLVQWWIDKDERRESRERNYEAETSLAQLLERFVLRADPSVSSLVLQPILQAVNSHPREVHDIVEGIILAEDNEPNTKQFWTLWSLFAERAQQATWISRLAGC